MEDSYFPISKFTTKLVTKADRYWHQDRHTDQQDRTESPEVKPQTKGQIIFDKCAKTTNREGVGFSTNGTRITEYPHEKNKDHYLTP